ncbi:conserved hypothetical protein [Phenylobacterium zucineum HLK1]|uniref:Uncharacterized protein n=1 Tax=Phenylobacterium zucineum (strain HLK1) TaxID=450851 RepID=B4R8C0_PHEZH|nr:hypothetical protein [Phenylobacterium zucineum]ACG79238.1 conserved hypothetical protein [Phenylobacterium zucineum HLK1]
MTRGEDLTAAARDELDRACTLAWGQIARHTPWGDTFEGFTPDGREVCFERAYLWDGEPGSDIRVEVTVYEPQAYEAGVKLTGAIPRDPFDIRSV